MSSNPKISVIMAVYNGMPYLPHAVRSILNQTYKNFEFIIVDDSSTDNSWRYLLKNQKNKKIKLIKNKKNIGLASSLNLALSAVNGQYIARMDADDISLPRRFEIQLNFLIKNPQVDICGSWAKLIDNKGEVIGQIQKPASDKAIKKMNQWITAVIHPTWFAKRKVFEELNGYNPDYDMVEDHEFLIRAKKFRMANINKELILWRSAQSRRSSKSIEKMYRKSLFLKWHYFKKGEFGPLYLLYLVRSLITTYLFPTQLKLFFNKTAGLM